MRTSRFIFCFAALLSLFGCSREGEQAAVTPHFDDAALARGATLYQHHCAQCHGPEAQGHPDWNTPSDGSFVAAPPLNGTGTDGSRSKQELVATILHGVNRGGMPVMPAWQGRLKDEEVESVLQWLQSLWPPDVYTRWHKANMASAGARR